MYTDSAKEQNSKSNNSIDIQSEENILKNEFNSNKNKQNKHLVVFDFDNTIIEGESFFEIIKLLPEELVKNIFSQYPNWYLKTEQIMLSFINLNISAEKIKDYLKKLKITKNFSDLLKYLFSKKNKFEVLIVSGTYDILIKWILDNNKILECIDEIHSEKALVENDFLKFIKPQEFTRCLVCNFCTCKVKILERGLKGRSYEITHFIGDGENDICPAMSLRDKDYLYPRKNYNLYKKIYEESYIDKIRSNIVTWENGENILDNFKVLYSVSSD